METNQDVLGYSLERAQHVDKICKSLACAACHLLLLVSCLAYCSSLKMEAVCSSEMSSYF
jgi:hypothetical protein